VVVDLPRHTCNPIRDLQGKFIQSVKNALETAKMEASMDRQQKLQSKCQEQASLANAWLQILQRDDRQARLCAFANKKIYNYVLKIALNCEHVLYRGVGEKNDFLLFQSV
jgi:antirestriction protein ArdC